MENRNSINKNISKSKSFYESTIKNMSGITLVALVVTIIILIILVGVSISVLLGENGLIEKAKEAKKQTTLKADEEKIKLAMASAQIGEQDYIDLTADNLETELIKNGSKAIVVENEDGSKTITFFDSKKVYKLDEIGNIEKIDIDFDSKFVAPSSQTIISRNVIGIGTDGNVVDMDLWQYSIEGETINLNNIETINKTESTAGYVENIEGAILGTIPQYISEDNGKTFKPVSKMYKTFVNCSTLTVFPKIPNTVTDLSATFQYCINLLEITNIPRNCNSLFYAFQHCHNLISISTDIPISVTNMQGAFSNCSNLKVMPKLPKTLENLTSTFSYCSNLEELKEIPTTVINMEHTFYNCSNLKNIYFIIPKNVDNIHQTFAGCTQLSGTIIINSSPSIYLNFLQNTVNQILLKGHNDSLLKSIASKYSNVQIVE